MAIAEGVEYSCPRFCTEDATDLQKCFEDALQIDSPALIEFRSDWALRPLGAQRTAKG